MIIVHLKHKIHLFDVRLALMDHRLKKDREKKLERFRPQAQRGNRREREREQR